VQRDLDEEPQPDPCSKNQSASRTDPSRYMGSCHGSTKVICKNCWRSVKSATNAVGSRCPRCGSVLPLSRAPD